MKLVVAILAFIVVVAGGLAYRNTQKNNDYLRKQQEEKQNIERKAALDKANEERQEALRVAEEKKHADAQTVIFKQRIVRMMKDPESVQFRELRFNSERDVLCGEVNARNGFGGYVGFKRFFVNEKMALVVNTDKVIDELFFFEEEKKAGCA